MAFGISPDRLAISPIDYLTLKEQIRKNLANEDLDRQGIFADLVNSRKSIKVGGQNTTGSSKIKHESSFLNQRQSIPQESQASTQEEVDRAQKLQNSRIQAQEKRNERIQQAQIDEAKAQAEHQRKIELEVLKSSLQGEKAKTMSDYKMQDVLNEINSGGLTIKKGDVFDPVADRSEAETAVKQRGFAVSHPDIQKALEERYAKPAYDMGTFRTALGQSKTIQSKTPTATGQQKTGTMDVIVTDRITGVPYRLNPQTGRWELVK